MLYRVVHEEPHLYEVHDALAPLVRACLAKDPEDRPSTLQLSMRLKEIAAREAQGLPESRPPAQRRAAEADRPTGRLAGPYTEQQTQRRAEGAPTPRPQASRSSSPRSGARPAARGTSRSNGRTNSRPGTRPGTRPTSAGRRPGPSPRMMRQRLIVFVVVTLIVLVGIAAAQQF